MPPEPRVILALGDARVTADASANFLEALREEAEASFGLEPDSYSFSDGIGKVDTAVALQRSLAMAGSDESLVLEVHEQPIWKKMREMEAKMKKMTEAQIHAKMQELPPARVVLTTNNTFEALESRILLKVEESLAELRSGLEAADERFNGTIAPVMRKLAMDQLEMREVLDHMDPEADMSYQKSEQLEELQGQIEEMAEEIQSLREQSESQVEEHEALASNTMSMRRDVHGLRDVTQLLQQAFKQLHNDVVDNEKQVCTLQEDCKKVIQTTTLRPSPACSPSPVQHRSRTSAMQEDLSGEAYWQQRSIASPPSWGGGASHGESMSSFAYSMKAPFAGSKRGPLGTSESPASSPFAKTGRGGLERGRSGALSLPQLRPIA